MPRFMSGDIFPTSPSLRKVIGGSGANF